MYAAAFRKGFLNMKKSDKNIAKPIAVAMAAAIAMTAFAGCQREIEPSPDVTTAPPIVSSDSVTTTEPEPVTDPIVTEPPVVIPEPLEKYADYYEQNSDFIGWISIPSLKNSKGKLYVDYPVVQAADNEKYIDLSFEGKKSSSGCIYADYKVPITATSHADNITLYGHSMKDGTFFRKVLDYKNGVDFVKEHYIINFDTRWEENRYVVVACFLIGIYEWQDDEPLFEYFKCRNFDTQKDFDYFYENIMHRSYYLSDIDCKYGDEFITLSTCAYDFKDSRYVVVARKVRENEDISGYADTYVKNKSRHKPSILD